METASEPGTSAQPNIFLPAPGHRSSPQIQREGLTSARYSTQNFRSSEEPLREQKGRLALELATESTVCLSTTSSLTQRAECGTSCKKRKKGQALGAGKSQEESPLGH